MLYFDKNIEIKATPSVIGSSQIYHCLSFGIILNSLFFLLIIFFICLIINHLKELFTCIAISFFLQELTLSRLWLYFRKFYLFLIFLSSNLSI